MEMRKDEYQLLLSNCEDELICFVCEEWCNSPVVLSKCGHYFCKDCVPKFDMCCPKCKEVFFTNDIEQIQLYDELREDIQFFRSCIDLLLGESTKVTSAQLPNDIPFTVTFLDSKCFKKNAKGESKLHLACKQKNLSRVKQLIEEGIDINSKDYAYWTPLHEAIQAESMEIVTELLANKPLINSPGEFYVTPLHKAVIMENVSIVKILIENGADKEALDFYGRKPADLTNIANLLEVINSTEIKKDIEKPQVFLCNKAVAYCHSIDDDYKNKISSLKNLRILPEFNIKKQELTHLIVKKTHKVSFKILLSMLAGVMIIRQDCVEDFLKGKTFISTEPVLEKDATLSLGIKKAFMNFLSNKPKLFDGMKFYLEVPDAEVKVCGLAVQKDILKLLIITGGGVLLSRAPAPRTVDELRCFPYHANINSSVFGCCNFIIFNENHPPKLQYNMKELKHKSSKWLIDCIMNFELM